MEQFWNGFEKKSEEQKHISALPALGTILGGLSILGLAQSAKSSVIGGGLAGGLGALGGHAAGKAVDNFSKHFKKVKSEGLPSDYDVPGRYPNG